MRYADKFVLVLLITLVSCKNNIVHNETKDKEVLGKNSIAKYSLEQFQGLWKSYSYYLEHEEDDKDEHKNEYYKIVSKNKCLVIILKQHNIDSVIYKTYEIGFVNNKSNFQDEPKKMKGSFFVKELKNIYPENITLSKEVGAFKTSSQLDFEFDTYDILNEYIDYNNFGIVERVQFKKVSSLPYEIYSHLKQTSKKTSVNYLNDFNIDKLSTKVLVNVPKCYFYEDKNLKNKKKAFLIKNDKAYLEQIFDNSVRVYFDGKKITSGYLKKSDVIIN